MNSVKCQNYIKVLNLTKQRIYRFGLVALFNGAIAAAMYHCYTISGSSALFAETIHNLCDCVCIVIATLASMVSTLEPKRSSYRYTRAETLTALLNSIIVAFAAVTIFRHLKVARIAGSYMIYAALFAIPVNFAGYAVLKNDFSLNARAVRLHLLIDCLFSSAIVAAGLFASFGVYWIDVAVAGVIAGHMLIHSIKIAKKSVEILMQLPPKDVKLEEIKKEIEKIPGVKDVHHMHIWQLDEFSTHFECHIRLDCELRLREADSVRESVEELLRRKGINHTTIQVECSCNGVCSLSKAFNSVHQ